MDNNLNQLIPVYGERDATIKALTKENNADKEKIKTLMENLDVADWAAGGYKVKRVVSTTETLNEDMLLTLMQRNRTLIEKLGILKTKEYVDMEALEKAIYEGELPKEILTDMDACRETKTTVALRCSKAKEE